MPNNGSRDGTPVVEIEKRRQIANESRSDKMGVRGHMSQPVGKSEFFERRGVVRSF